MKNAWMARSIDGEMEKWKDGEMERWKDEQKNICIDGWRDGWIDG